MSFKDFFADIDRREESRSRLKRDRRGCSSVALNEKNLNVSAGGAIYERAKSRRERHRNALLGDAETAKPLRRSGTQTSQTLVTLNSSSRRDSNNNDTEEEFIKKGNLRIMKIRSAMVGHGHKSAKLPPIICNEFDLTPKRPRMEDSNNSIERIGRKIKGNLHGTKMQSANVGFGNNSLTQFKRIRRRQLESNSKQLKAERNHNSIKRIKRRKFN